MRSTRAFPHELKTTQVSNTLKIFAVLPVRSLAKRSSADRGPTGFSVKQPTRVRSPTAASRRLLRPVQ
jgi:hypothetical protein